mgnify:CR=1 FL=1
MTGIHGGERVPKDDIRIEANGCIDELNTVIGIVRSLLPVKDVWQELLHDIQRELMVVMSMLQPLPAYGMQIRRGRVVAIPTNFMLWK